MKTHRPWQPRLSNDPLFNPFAPTTDRDVTLDRIEIAGEEEEEVSVPEVTAAPTDSAESVPEQGEEPSAAEQADDKTPAP